MKKGKLFFGLGFILLALAILLDAFDALEPIKSAVGEISIVRLLLAFLLVVHVISQISKKKIDQIFISLALVFLLLEKNFGALAKPPVEDLINNWLLIGCAVLLQIGFSVLFSDGGCVVTIEGAGERIGEEECDDETGKYTRHSSATLTSTVRYIAADTFGTEYVENNLASTVIRFDSPEKYFGGGVLHLENNLGSIVVEIPKEWRFETDVDKFLGSVQIPRENRDLTAPLVKIFVENNLGAVTLKYV